MLRTGVLFILVDGVIRGNQIHFFVPHEDENDPEVKANSGEPFHNLTKGTLTENEIVVSGSRENTTIREYRLVLKRIGNQGQRQAAMSDRQYAPQTQEYRTNLP